MKSHALTFLKSIITSDFSAINPLFLKHATAPVRSTVGFSKEQIYGNLDLLVLNRSLKQFIRTLQFFNKRKGTLNIFIKQDSLEVLMSGLLSELKDSKRVLLNQVVMKTEAPRFRRRHANPSLLLDKEFSRVSYLGKFQQNRSYLINTINLIHNIVSAGHYHVYNDLISLEKRVFLSLLLRSAIKVPLVNVKKKVAKIKDVPVKKKKKKSLKVAITVKAAEVVKKKKIAVPLNWGPFKKKSKKQMVVCLKTLNRASTQMRVLRQKVFPGCVQIHL